MLALTITDFFQAVYDTVGPGTLIVLAIVAFIGIIAQWVLYAKCNLPGIACLVPFWNVAVFLRIMGRPAWHMVFLIIPLYNIYFIIKVYIELCQCFGKTSTIDYVLIIIFNGFYILNLALSYETKYLGPVYSKNKEEPGTSTKGEPQLA